MVTGDELVLFDVAGTEHLSGAGMSGEIVDVSGGSVVRFAAPGPEGDRIVVGTAGGLVQVDGVGYDSLFGTGNYRKPTVSSIDASHKVLRMTVAPDGKAVLTLDAQQQLRILTLCASFRSIPPAVARFTWS